MSSEYFYIMDRKGFILVGLLLVISPITHAVELTGALGTHDPSRIMKDSTRYWFYMTGNGIPMSFSDNLTSWRMTIYTVFPAGTWPAWVNTAVPGFGGNFWAPDLISMKEAMKHAAVACHSASSAATSSSLISRLW